jgi:hypothetical protein
MREPVMTALQSVYEEDRRLRDRIAELEAIINRAGALASQGASHEMIRETLAEAKATK